MEMNKVLLACAVLCSIVSVAFSDLSHIGKACNDSARPIDDITRLEISAFYRNGRYEFFPSESYDLTWEFKTPSDIDIEKVGNILEMECDKSGEIKGKGEVTVIHEKDNFPQYMYGDGSTELGKNLAYVLRFEGKFDKKPTDGDNCQLDIIVTLNDEEKSYCITDKAVFAIPKIKG